MSPEPATSPLGESTHLSIAPAATEDGWMLTVFGSFNPRIFRPSWLLQEGLLSDEEQGQAQSNLVSDRAMTAFRTNSMMLEVTYDRLLLRTTRRADFERLRNIAARVFHSLPHTPVESVAFTRDQEYDFRSPQGLEEFFSHMIAADLRETLRDLESWSLTLSSPLHSSRSGERSLFLEDSTENEFGVYLGVIDKITLRDENDLGSASSAALIIESDWIGFSESAEDTLGTIIQMKGRND